MGALVNSLSIIVGGLIGLFGAKRFDEKVQDSLNKTCGISVLFIGIAGAMEGMLSINDNILSSGKSLLIVLCLALGTIIGEIINIEKAFNDFGIWLKNKTGNTSDNKFVDAFVTASLTVSIGAMAIVGAIQDGILNDHSTLFVKAVLDFIIILIMASSLGKGAIFSFIPVFIFEELITLLAKLISPFMTDLAVSYISLIGSILIFCIGINLIWGKKISVVNMLPSIFLALLAAYLPFSF